MNTQQAITEQLVTIADFIRFGASRFNQAECFFGHGTDNAFDEAATLVMHVLHLPIEIDSALLNCRLIDAEKAQILELFQQRIDAKCPAAYLTNQAYFAGLPFYVDERVLVPRSPIAELIQKQFKGIVARPPTRILDLCTGSGCIAIACAYAFSNAEVDAVDLSVDALNVAQINIESHGVEEQVIPIQSDLFSGVAGQKYDLIVTNPPYVDAEDMANLPVEFQHEPEIGLASGEDGLDITHQILIQAPDFLTEQGVLVCEVGNSMVHLAKLYPEIDFHWQQFAQGGHGVLVLTKAELISYQAEFKKRVVR